MDLFEHQAKEIFAEYGVPVPEGRVAHTPAEARAIAEAFAAAGKPGRPSRSLNLEQALVVLDAARGERLWPYVAVRMLGVIRLPRPRLIAETGL